MDDQWQPTFKVNKPYPAADVPVCPACNGLNRIWYCPDGPDDYTGGPEGWAHWMYCPACPDGRKAQREAPVYSQN